MNHWRAIGPGLRAGWRALTLRGRCFVTSGLVCLAMGVLLGEPALLRAGVLLLVLPAACAAAVTRTRYRMQCSRTLSPDRVSAGAPATVALTVDNVARLPTAALLMEDELPYALGPRPRFVLPRLSAGASRAVSYQVLPPARGRFRIGPLAVRLSDPFGCCELSRSFAAAADLLVTPALVSLPALPLGGDWTGAGSGGANTVGSMGEADVAVRDYRRGDDRRKVHWRSTARTGALMVRREEQPWQSRATLVLDDRAAAHRGSGPASSFEWAVGACASIAAHLGGRGFGLSLEGTGGALVPPTTSSLARASLLDALAVCQTHQDGGLGPLTGRLSTDTRRGVLVALLGALGTPEARALAALPRAGAPCLAVLIETAGWTGQSAAARESTQAALQACMDLLRAGGWRVTVARPDSSIAQLWPLMVRPHASARVPT